MWHFNEKNKIFILAEIGTNHNGDVELAKTLIQEAAQAGADGVKFQTFQPNQLVHKSLPVYAHAQGQHKTQYERLESLRLKPEQFCALKKLADTLGIVFLSTPLDENSVDMLEPLIPYFKVASGDITNIPLLRHIATKNKPIILSTGMATEDEIRMAVEQFTDNEILLLHCVSRYPTPLEDVNLLSIPYLKDKFNLPVGYSDHAIGIEACLMAAATGAIFIEKHFTNDKSQSFGDHKLSMDSKDLRSLISEIRHIEKMLGIYGKPIQKEVEASKVMRRSLYAKVPIEEGAVISPKMIVALRPATGLQPSMTSQLIGKKAKMEIKEGEKLKLEMFTD